MLEDSEIFDLDDLEKYQLKQELVAHALEKHTARPEEFTARGLLPLGGMGEARLNTLSGAAADFSKKLELELAAGPPGEPLAVDLRIGGFSLTGKIESIHGGNIVQFRFAKITAKDWLNAWINHLAKCATSPETPGGTVLVGDGETVRFAPVKDAAGLLAGLLEIYWSGLKTPSAFFPSSALEYAQAEINPSPKARTSPIDKARKKWNGDERRSSGEKHNAYNARCFTAADPLDADFTKLALEVFEPMLRYATSVK